MMQRIEKTFAGRRLIIETGRMAKQAAGSAVVTFGDTFLALADVQEVQNQPHQRARVATDLLSGAPRAL
jgi:polyribonucleotide nucleotidyltransferase